MGPADIVVTFILESELIVVTLKGDIWRWDEQDLQWLKVGRISRDAIE